MRERERERDVARGRERDVARERERERERERCCERERERDVARERERESHHYMRPTVLLIYSCLLLTDIHSRTLEYLLDDHEHIEKCSINIFLASYPCCQFASAWSRLPSVS